MTDIVNQTDTQQNAGVDIVADHIGTDDIMEVARLARLAVDEETAQSYADDLDKILAMMETIADVDTEGLTPLSNVHEAAQTLRADGANPDIDREQNQSIAPSVEQGLYLVPQVIE